MRAEVKRARREARSWREIARSRLQSMKAFAKANERLIEENLTLLADAERRRERSRGNPRAEIDVALL